MLPGTLVLIETSTHYWNDAVSGIEYAGNLDRGHFALVLEYYDETTSMVRILVDNGVIGWVYSDVFNILKKI